MQDPRHDGIQTHPFYFGPAQRLFGILDAPSQGGARPGGVVICQPFGHEYQFCHRACRQLAAQFAAVGLSALRFDYRGCGDSLGESHEAAFDDWRADLSNATEYLRLRCESIAVVGLRMGASLAVLASLRQIDAAVLWEPISDGGSYLEELAAMHDERSEPYIATGLAAGPGIAEWMPQEATEHLGFGYSAAAIAAIESVDLRTVTNSPSSRLLVLSNTDRGEFEPPSAWRTSSDAIETRRVEEAPSWIEKPAIVPAESLSTIVEWVSERLP